MYPEIQAPTSPDDFPHEYFLIHICCVAVHSYPIIHTPTHDTTWIASRNNGKEGWLLPLTCPKCFQCALLSIIVS